MSAPTLPVPAAVDRLGRSALVAGVVGLGLTLVGWLAEAGQFHRSYLFAYLFWLGVAIGCLSIVMIQHLTGGLWGMVSRRFLEAGTRTLPLLVLLFLPLLPALPDLYVWARPESVAKDPLLLHKSLYLNVPFFLSRAAFYFVIWLLLAHFLNRWSLELDAGPNLKISRRLRSLSGPGLVLMGLTITFSSVDWGMSLNPHWFSTIYGMIFMVGQALSALALVVALLALLGGQAPLRGVVRKETLHDLGKLLFAFVMLWAYVNISQFIIVWSGNLPEEIPFYLDRFRGGWGVVGVAVLVLHFVLPFLLLLSRDVKRNPRALASVAGALFLLRAVDLYWLVGPDLGPHGGHGFHLHWLDLTALVGIGGLWLWAFARQLKGRPLLPVGEPEIQGLLEEAGA